MLHVVSILTALSGVFASNYQVRRPSRSMYLITWALTLGFALCCYRECGFMGLFLSFMSPNVTDILNSLRK